jgi:ribonucleoside-diphosphate reductase alpha chain
LRAETANPEVADFIWRTKYRAPGEANVSHTWDRVAAAVASVETEPAGWALAFRQLLEGCRFLPGGRILAGAGAAGAATLNNCFVMGPIEDTAEGLARAWREAEATLAAGGGIGVDLSTLTPRGGTARDGSAAPGPVAVLELWDAACGTSLAGSARHGAMMGALACDHPEIADFVAAKRRAGVLSRFNLSVQVTDAFMAAVAAGADWPLAHGGRVSRTVRAAELWDSMVRSAYETGEPGVLFIDHINAANNLGWREHITAANPCGEVPLPPYGACVLGSINLTRLVERPFAESASLDHDALAETARLGVRFLDDVIDLTGYPLPQQAEVARATRRIGLGVTGLADALVMLGAPYGRRASLRIAGDAVRTIRDAAYRASIDLAVQKGAFPAFEREPYLRSPFVRRLPEDIRKRLATSGIRNSHLLAIAPTGSISLLAGGASTGVEPIFAAVQTRNVLDARGAAQKVELEDPSLVLWRSLGRAGLPPAFVTAADVQIAGHIAMQAALQPLVDNAISKTINVPGQTTFEQFRGVFDEAWRRGLKGCTAFRPTRKRQGVLRAAHAGATCQAVAEPCD